MSRYIARRFISAIVSIIGASFIVFTVSVISDDPLLLYAKPGGHGMAPGQVEALESKLGLDKPVIVQWALWLGRAVQGDLGQSIFDERPVTDKILERAPATLKLGIASWIFATVVGIPLGVLSALKRATIWDYTGRVLALMADAIPNFWLGIMLMLIFSVSLGWLPVATSGPGFLSLPHLVLPTFVLGANSAAGYMRITRSAMLESLDSEYVRLARSKGLNGATVVWKHAFRNALIPPVTVSSVLLVGFITGSVLIETVFAWPGLGKLAVTAVNNNDFPLVTGITMVFVTVWVAFNFITDLVYVWIDPRIRLN
ncbi:MAG: ABC transporter permease [Chloroflexota bacterium]